MGRALAAVSIALMLLFAIALGLIAIFQERDEMAVDNLLAERITRALYLANDQPETVTLSALTPFEWDEMILVEQGTSFASVARRFDPSWRATLNFATGDTLVFLNRGRITRYADYRGDGRWAEIKRPIAVFKESDARFRVNGLAISPYQPRKSQRVRLR